MYRKFLKQWLDFVIVLCVLLVIWPVLAMIAVWLHFANKGAGVFFTQERPGKDGKIFKVIKFKSMTDERDAEGKLLPDAQRLTRVGRFIRSTSLDELPQLLNVLKGDMSLVGPRPERKYFIDQIVKVAPYYYLLHNVRPGITSLGMVKYGYAASLPQMIERMEYDIMYYENMSLMLDLTILIYTIKTVVTGKGV